ncbi:hypothetical protein KEM54_000670 [Ascosphaera aggregata]|nr:hypothetical protein KEM54_000670 [Ascosphaera aggregata]
MHGFIHHKHIVDQGLAYFSDRFLLQDKNLSINWPALASFLIYSSIFTVVYPITFAIFILYNLLHYALLLIFHSLKSALHLIIWPFSWLTLFEPLYIYLSFAILIGLSAGLLLYAISEGVSHCLEQIASYFGTATPLLRCHGGNHDANGGDGDDNVDGEGDDDEQNVVTRPLLMRTGDSFIHDWMEFDDADMTSFTMYRRTVEEEKNSRMEIKKHKKRKTSVVWRSPPAKDLALFPLSRIMDEDRDEPNYDSDEGEPDMKED